MKINHYLKLIFVTTAGFGVLPLSILFGTKIIAQQKNNQHKDKLTQSSAAEVYDKTDFLPFSIEAKERYYLGEKPLIKLVITNTSGSEQRVLKIEHRKYRVRGEGIFNNGDGVRESKDFNFNGRYLVFKEPPCLPKQSCDWIDPLHSEPTYMTLKAGETTSVEVDLNNGFSTDLFYPGKYKITAKTEDGEQETAAEFEVYFDEEKSTPILEQKLREDGTGFYLLSRYNRVKLITVLEDMRQSNDKESHERANRFFDSLRTMDEHNLKRRNQ